MAGGSLFGSGFISSSVRSYMEVGGIENAMSHVFIDSVLTNCVSKALIDGCVSQSAFRTAVGVKLCQQEEDKEVRNGKNRLRIMTH